MQLHVRNTVLGLAVLVGVCAVWYAASFAGEQESKQEEKKEEEENTVEDE